VTAVAGAIRVLEPAYARVSHSQSPSGPASHGAARAGHHTVDRGYEPVGRCGSKPGGVNA
jgi:hypothetical protein